MVVLFEPVKPRSRNTQGKTPGSCFPSIPVVDVSDPESKHALIKACRELGFFKVINHGVPTEFTQRLEAEAVKFFSLPESEKSKAGPAVPFGYGNKKIGSNGDFGWVEYLLMNADIDSVSTRFIPSIGQNPENFRAALQDYTRSVKRMACEVLEMMAEGLQVQPKNALSKFLMDQSSDSLFRLNHYPPCPVLNRNENCNVIGFGEHTDPQIISVLRSNNTSGLQISLPDGSWLSIPPDHSSFFFNVGDSLQVMTNGRFKSLRHRVLANSMKSRVSMVYFGGPSLDQKIAPLPSLMEEKENSLYREFTWFEYKKSAFNSRLADNRLLRFENLMIDMLSDRHIM